MTWKIRHEGSPQAVEGLSLEDVLQGLADGNWEPTDEVMGPNESAWTKLEDHPQFAELAAELEPPPPRTYGDEEAHVDMNALIDVCMVLLIFFILTTSYAALQSRLDSPNLAAKDDRNTPEPREVNDRELGESIHVVVEMEKGEAVIRIDGMRVAPEQVENELRKIVQRTKKSTLLLEVDPKVPVGVSLPIQYNAAVAGLRDILRVVKEK